MDKFSRPFGTSIDLQTLPTAEAVGYFQASLRDFLTRLSCRCITQVLILLSFTACSLAAGFGPRSRSGKVRVASATYQIPASTAAMGGGIIGAVYRGRCPRLNSCGPSRGQDPKSQIPIPKISLRSHPLIIHRLQNLGQRISKPDCRAGHKDDPHHEWQVTTAHGGDHQCT